MEAIAIENTKTEQIGNFKQKEIKDISQELSEESLLPSNLLNETEYELYPKLFFTKTIQYPQPKVKCPFSNNGLFPTLIPTMSNNIPVINRKHYYLFFEGNIKNLVSQIKTHQGSVYLQYSLAILNNIETNTLLFRLSPYLTELMCSHYGNYFIQKLFLKLEYNQRLFIFNLIQYNFISLCADKSGTYSIQTLIDSIKTTKEEMILQNFLCSNLLFLFCNENAHHVIQKVIIDFPEHKREYINNFLVENVDKICTNEYGALCTVKFIIMNSNLNLRLRLVKSFEKNFFTLISNKFGCSILLFFMEKYGLGYSSFIVSEIKKNLFYFSSQESFVMNLVEKVIIMIYKYDNKEYVNMTWVLLKNEKLLKKLLENQNGMRIVLAFLEHSTSEQKNFFKSRKLNFALNDKSFYEKIMPLIL